jgi:hypothetical protein
LRDVIALPSRLAHGRRDAPLRRLGVGLYADACRCRAAHGNECAFRPRGAQDRTRLSPGRADRRHRAQAHRGASPRARAAEGRAGDDGIGTGTSCGCRRLGREEHGAARTPGDA